MNKAVKSSATMGMSEIRTIEIDSLSLRGNTLKDAHKRKLPIYLPAGYGEGKKRYPVVYMLAAFGYRAKKLLNDNLWEENIQERLDRLIHEQKIRPMLMVLPDTTTRYGGSQYLNSEGTGRYEDYLIEIIDRVDQEFPTIEEREFRAVMGHSSGGYGALLMGMRHADRFGLVADHSGDKFFELVFQPEFGSFLRFFESNGRDGLMSLLSDPGAALRAGAPFGVLNIAAMAACYSPNNQSDIGFDLPFDLKTGMLRDDVWASWKRWDPVEMVDDYESNLRSLKLLFFDCGRWDEHNLVFGARLFKERLDKKGIHCRFEEYDGGHRNVEYRYDISLQAISRAMPR